MTGLSKSLLKRSAASPLATWWRHAAASRTDKRPQSVATCPNSKYKHLIGSKSFQSSSEFYLLIYAKRTSPFQTLSMGLLIFIMCPSGNGLRERSIWLAGLPEVVATEKHFTLVLDTVVSSSVSLHM